MLAARPNFVKAAPVIRAIGELGVAQEVVHTGQHYDEVLSDVFFRQLDLPEPARNLHVGSGTHAEQTAAALVALEAYFVEAAPPLVVVYGDVNSTLAAALAAAKLVVPVAHVEAGLRSFDRTMPEELNRTLTDAVADLLFVTSPEGVERLAREGIPGDRVHFVGNPMIDTLTSVLPRLDAGPLRQRLGLGERFGLVTLHRPANVDDPARARRIVDALARASELVRFVVPLHPRGREALRAGGIEDHPRLAVVDPLGYEECLALMAESAVVVTDSGGIQEETTLLGVPCLTVRPNTERPVTITHGTNRLVEPEDVPAAVAAALDGGRRRTDPPPLWDGRAGPRIAAVIEAWLRRAPAGTPAAARR